MFLRRNIREIYFFTVDFDQKKITIQKFTKPFAVVLFQPHENQVQMMGWQDFLLCLIICKTVYISVLKVIFLQSAEFSG